MNPETPQTLTPAPAATPAPVVDITPPPLSMDGPKKKVSPGRIVLYVFTVIMIIAIGVLTGAMVFLSWGEASSVTGVLSFLIGILTLPIGVVASALTFYSLLSLFRNKITQNRKAAGLILIIASLVAASTWMLSSTFLPIIITVTPWLWLSLPINAILGFIHGIIYLAKAATQKIA